MALTWVQNYSRVWCGTDLGTKLLTSMVWNRFGYKPTHEYRVWHRLEYKTTHEYGVAQTWVQNYSRVGCGTDLGTKLFMSMVWH